MSLYRYSAIPKGGGSVQSGEISAPTDADVRTNLRRIGLQPLDVRAIRETPRIDLGPLKSMCQRHLRSRRSPAKAEFYDALATMLDAGIPLDEALDAMLGKDKRMRVLLRRVRDDLRGGSSLSESCSRKIWWFDAAETAMLAAGERSGELSGVLRALAERRQRAGELTTRLIGALSYPMIVLIVGIGVTIFLSTTTLPNLVGILHDADVRPPPLSLAVMSVGQFMRAWIWSAPLFLLLVLIVWMTGTKALERRGIRAPRVPVPRALRLTTLAGALLTLAELLRVGVPMVEALRVAGPSITGLGSARLQSRLIAAAEGVEQGQPISDALADPEWFDEEIRRLILTGETAGELDSVLGRIGDRAQRGARRSIDQLSALVEPAAILVLAGLVGIVVMAAILPLIKLKEIIG